MQPISLEISKNSEDLSIYYAPITDHSGEEEGGAHNFSQSRAIEEFLPLSR